MMDILKKKRTMPDEPPDAMEQALQCLLMNMFVDGECGEKEQSPAK